MNAKYGLGVGIVATMFSGAAWLGCGDDTVGTPPGGRDGGTPDATMATPDGGGGAPDTGTPALDSGAAADTGSTADTGTTTVEAGDAGGACQTYCTNIMSACGTAAPFAQYQSMDECLFTCSLLQTAPADQQVLTAVGDLACREQHSLYALDAGQSPHCWHAGPYGGSVCGDPCTSFCFLDTQFCSAAYGYDGGAPYSNMAACISKCQTYPTIDSASAGWDHDGGFSAKSGATGTFDCREYHLLNAMASGAGSTVQSIHCPHTSSNNLVCGNNDVVDAGDAGVAVDSGSATDGSDGGS